MVAAREVHQFVACGVDDPDIAAGGIADPMHHPKLSPKVEATRTHQRLTIEIEDGDGAGEAARPHLVRRDTGAPADAIEPFNREADNVRGQGFARRGELDHAPADGLVKAVLGTGHPIHAAPEISVLVDSELARGIDAAAREAHNQREVIGYILQIGNGCVLAPAFTLWEGVVARKEIEQGRRLGPWLASDCL